jgi:hypothetical protein
MDDKLATRATQVKFRILPGKPGSLRLEDGFIAFTLGDGTLVFRAPLHEMRASFPKVTLFWVFPLFGTGVKLAMGGNTYRLLFVPIEYKLGWGSTPGSGATWSASWGPTWSFSWEGLKQGRAAVRQWRAVFGQPATEADGPVARWNALLIALVVVVPAAVIAVIAIANSSSSPSSPSSPAQSDLRALQQDDRFTSDLSTLTSDARQAGTDMTTTKSDAALGADCYNVSTVKIDASTAGIDASTVGIDLQTLNADIGTATQDIATLKDDLANLRASGRPATPGAATAIAAAGQAIKQAVRKANSEIDQVNADVTQAYSLANGMATGSCSGDGPGRAPAPIRYISSK